jgi:aryl carrier-like protein
MTTTITTPISSREEILEKSEFSLVETSTGDIAGQLRFQPGLDRIAIRELVAELRQKGEILHQRCLGNAETTIGWSSLLFVASLATYHWLKAKCQASNLESLRNATAAKLASLEAEAVLRESEVENQAESSKLAESIETADKAQTHIEVEVQTKVVSPELASNEQLLGLTLSKLKKLAATHNIVGRSSMTKNLNTARQLLVPKLVGVVTVTEL